MLKKMFKKILKKRGFTLVEMLVAMSIFMIFTGVLLYSYTDIVRSLREGNDYREMYSEARRVFETVVQEFRDGMVDYGNGVYQSGCNPSVFENGKQDIYLISKDGLTTTKLYLDEEVVKLKKWEKDSAEPPDDKAMSLNSSDVIVKEFKISPYPFVDPYDQRYVEYSGYQFHPQVRIEAVFEKEKRNGENFELELHTTISSRIYNQVYPIKAKCSS